MRVLITGACGFVARALARELEANHELRLLDRCRPEDATVFSPGKPERERAPLQTTHEFVVAAITDEAAMVAACEGMDAVIHLAASVSGLPHLGVETFRDNALGTFIVLDAAHRAGSTRFLCASSVNAYGTIYWRLSGQPAPYRTMPLDESFEVVPEDPYSLSKYVNEETCAAYQRAYGMTTAAFRFGGIWTDAMYRERMAAPLPPTTAWSDDVYHWVHIDDVARGIRQALECPALPGFGVYTLSGADTRCPEPTMELLERFRPDLAAAVTEPLVGRAPLMSIRRAAEAFGYAPSIRLGP